MLNIYELQTNTITVNSLYEKATIPDASLHYIWEFKDFYNRSIILTLSDFSTVPTRYSTFYFTDGSDGTIRASGEYNIYEWYQDASAIDASMNILENGQYMFWDIEAGDYVYEPSVYTISGQDSVFSPLFNSNDTSIVGFPHNYLTNRDLPSNHPWALPEASLGTTFYWDNGYLEASGTGGISDYDEINGGTNWSNPTSSVVNGGTY